MSINGTCMAVYYSNTVVAEGCITKEVVVSTAEFVLARPLYIQYKMKCKLASVTESGAIIYMLGIIYTLHLLLMLPILHSYR